MINWEILNIEPTKDVDVIKQAYRTILVHTNPEDSPKEFMELRKAYEDAMAAAVADDEEDTVDDSPIGVWINKVDTVYKDFSKRIDVDVWKELLSDDVCIALDSCIEARDRLIIYLLDHIYIPHEIWVVINDAFDLLGAVDDLKENFSEDYVDYWIVPAVTKREIFDYYKFNPDIKIDDYDKFISDFYKLHDAIEDNKLDEAEKKLNDLDDVIEAHPYLCVEVVKYYCYKKYFEKAKMLSDKLLANYNDDVKVLYAKAEVKYFTKEYDNAISLYENILEIEPKYLSAFLGLADTYYEKKDYYKSKKYYSKVYNIVGSDERIKNCIDKTNVKLIEEYENKIKEIDTSENKTDEQLDEKYILDICWCYLQSDKNKEAIKILSSIKQAENLYEYYDLMCKAYYSENDMNKTKEYTSKWIELMESIPEDTQDEQLIKETSNLSQAYRIQGYAHSNLKEYDEALECINKAIKAGDSTELAKYYADLADIYITINKYSEAIEACDKGINIDSSNFSVNFNKAVALYHLGEYIKSYEMFEETNKIKKYIASYVYQMKILYLYDKDEMVLDIANMLEEEKVETDYCGYYKTFYSFLDNEFDDDGNLIRKEKNDYSKYKKVYLSILDNILNDKTDLFKEDKAELCFELAYMESLEDNYKQGYEHSLLALSFSCYQKQKDRMIRTALDCLKGLSDDNEHDEHDYKADLKHFRQEIKDDNLELLYPLGRLFDEYDMYEEELECVGKILKIEPSLLLYRQQGHLLYNKGMYDKAIQSYNKALDIENVDKLDEERKASIKVDIYDCYIEMNEYDFAKEYLMKELNNRYPNLELDNIPMNDDVFRMYMSAAAKLHAHFHDYKMAAYYYKRVVVGTSDNYLEKSDIDLLASYYNANGQKDKGFKIYLEYLDRVEGITKQYIDQLKGE